MSENEKEVNTEENDVITRGAANTAFKGIWIPCEIWENQNLNYIDKLVYACITRYENVNHETLYEKVFTELGISKPDVEKSLINLEKLEIISISKNELMGAE